jgi:intracellular sulfur oxidation DsrE/DsrF family protein
MLRIATLVLGLFVLAVNTNTASAEANGNAYFACPAGYAFQDAGGNDLTIDDEFGPGSTDITRCLANRTRVKLVMQINKACRDSYVDANGKVTNSPANCSNGNPKRAYGLAQLNAMYNDFTITNGMPGEGVDMVAVVHDAGGLLMLKGNPYENMVKGLMAKGVRFYFCQNTVRGFIDKGILTAGGATASVIDGVEYVTGGLTALADFQQAGYVYIQP